MTETAEQQQPEQPLNKFEDSTWAKLDEEIGYQHTEPFKTEKAEDKVEELLNGLQQEKKRPDTPEQEIEIESNGDLEDSEKLEADASDPGDGQGEAEASEETEEQQVDYDQLVPMNDGNEPMSIGAMKDELTTWRRDAEKNEKALQTERNDMMQDRQLLMNLLDSLGELPPETMAHLQTYQRNKLNREGRLMMAAIPEWSDNTVYLKDQVSMKQMAQEYGFSESEFRGLQDHRLVKLVRDYSLLKNKVNSASKPKPEKKAAKKPNKHNRVTDEKRLNNLINEAARSTDRNFKHAAISKLLGN